MCLFKKLLTRAMRGQLSKLDTLYQRHAGQECYLFGAGTSLKWMDLQQFSDRPSILGNFVIYHKEVNALNFPYCTLLEPLWFWPLFPYPQGGSPWILRNSVNKEYRKSIIQNYKTLFFINFSNYPVARFPNALYVSRFYKSPFEKNNPFSERPDSHDGTLKFQLALAMYLGFKKAYLVGHDYTHFPSRTGHFYEKGDGVMDDNRNFSREFIDYISQKMDLVTVTLKSGSEMMHSITYKDLTGKEPCFRENVDIVDMTKLKSLDAWLTYSIF